MPLARQTIEIPLGVGVDTKTDPKVVQPGAMLTLENGEFDEAGAVSKRNGYTPISMSIMGGSSVASAKVIKSYGNELTLLDGSKLYSFSSEAGKWVDRGTCVLAGIKTSRVPASSASQASDVGASVSGIATTNGYTAVIWSSSTGGVYATVYGADTGAVVVACAKLATALSRRRVCAVASGTKIFLLYATPANMKMQYFDTTLPASGLSSATNLVTDVNSNAVFDCKDFDGAGTCALSYRNTTGGGQISTVKFTSAGVTAGPTVTAVTPVDHIGVVVSAAGDIYTGYKNSADGDFRCFALTSSLSSKFGDTLVEACTAANRFVGIEQSTNSILWVYGDLISSVYQVRKATIDSAGTVSGAGLVISGANIASGIFTSGGVFYFIADSTTTLGQAGFWLVNTSGEVCGNTMAGFAMVSNAGAPSAITSLGNGMFLGVGLTRFDADNAYVPVEIQIEMGRLCYPQEFAQSLYVPGAQLWQYDGAQVVEHGFLTPPVATGVNAAGGGLADGSYEISAVYEWYDSHGRRHESAPSIADTVVISGGGGVRKITATIQTLRLTNKTGVKIVLYASDVDGTTLYRVSASDNDKTVDSISIDFTSTSGSFTSGEILYTNGGTLENTAPPGLQCLVAKGRRLYGVTFDGVVNYTKELVDGQGASFVAETLVRKLRDDGTDYSIAEMDDQIIVAGRQSIQVLSGDGLNDTGTSDTLSEPRLVASESGADANSPLVKTDIGVLLKSPKGFCLLTRSLQVDDRFGYPVGVFDGRTIVSAVSVPDKRQVRFGLEAVDGSDGETPVFDSGAGQWSVFTQIDQISATIWNDTYYLLSSNGVVWKENEGFEDDGVPVSYEIETPWIRLAGLQGFQRLYHVSLLGEWRSAHTLSLSIYYDYSQSASKTKTFDASTGYVVGDPLQFTHHIGRKCEAVRFKITDSNHGGTKESCTLTAIALEVGGKGGVFRQGKARTV